MFALKKNTKEAEDKRANQPLGKKGKKQGKLLVKGVKKFLRYNDDLIADDERVKIHEKRDEFIDSLDDETLLRKDVEEKAKKLTDQCKKSVKSYRPSAMKENIEVIFVAVVIAMGIRAYFIQQFKIPTGSMQPTLNGIVAHADPKLNPDVDYKTDPDYEAPNIVKKGWDKFWYGRSHVEWIAEEDDFLLFDKSHFYDANPFLFFPRTYLITQSGKKFSAPGTSSRVASLFNFSEGNFIQHSRARDIDKLRAKGTIKVSTGDVIARGFIDTGDQLVVDKFTYHWRNPKRGEVFVFNTKDIAYIQNSLDDRRQGSQHYIKRLVGVPGDTVEVKPPFLHINGEEAKEPGMVRVASQEGYYTGYVKDRTSYIELPDKKYWAMGDNSANSSDSRTWGTVPEKNIVGRAAFVYYPFGHHFGKIR